MHTDDRVLNDLDERHSHGDLRYFEEVAWQIVQLMNDAALERTRDCIQITEIDEAGVVLLVTPDSVEFRLPTVEWPHPHTPTASSRFDYRVSLDEIELDNLPDLVERARQKRRQQFRECSCCGRPTPPEHAHEIDGQYVCHGCSERELGIIH